MTSIKLSRPCHVQEIPKGLFRREVHAVSVTVKRHNLQLDVRLIGQSYDGIPQHVLLPAEHVQEGEGPLGSKL